MSSCETSDAEGPVPVNSAAVLRKSQPAPASSPCRGHVLRKAKVRSRPSCLRALGWGWGEGQHCWGMGIPGRVGDAGTGTGKVWWRHFSLRLCGWGAGAQCGLLFQFCSFYIRCHFTSIYPVFPKVRPSYRNPPFQRQKRPELVSRPGPSVFRKTSSMILCPGFS